MKNEKIYELIYLFLGVNTIWSKTCLESHLFLFPFLSILFSNISFIYLFIYLFHFLSISLCTISPFISFRAPPPSNIFLYTHLPIYFHAHPFSFSLILLLISHSTLSFFCSAQPTDEGGQYHPLALDDPTLTKGKHRTVMMLCSFRVSILLSVKKKAVFLLFHLRALYFP